MSRIVRTTARALSRISIVTGAADFDRDGWVDLYVANDGRENLLPYGDFAFNAFGPRNEIVTHLEKTMPPTIAWIGAESEESRTVSRS